MRKNKSLLLSVFLWGSGQIFICRQRFKGLLFLIMQMIFLSLEFFAGYWFEYFTGVIPLEKFSLRLHGGVFSKGIWGLVTLGEKAGGKNGDHSTMLLINGVIAVILLTIFIAVYIGNLKDAYYSGKRIDDTEKYENSKLYFENFFSKNFPYVVLAPIAIGFIFVVVMPIIFTFLTAFLNYNRNNLPPGSLLKWVGFSNVAKLFTVPIWSSTFIKVLKWTVIWTVTATFGTYSLGLFQALILNHNSVKYKKLFRTILILPWAIPQMVTLLVFRSMFNGQFGPINRILISSGLISHNIPFLSDPLIAKITLIIVNLWLGFPMFMVMISGILSNMDESVYEAASIDGANRLHTFSKITMPLLLRATTPNLIMSMAANFNGFGVIYFLTLGDPVSSNMQFAGETDILISWIYKLTLTHQMYDIAAVMSIILFIVVGSVSFWNFRRTASFKEL